MCHVTQDVAWQEIYSLSGLPVCVCVCVCVCPQVSLQEREFLVNGGDPSWMEGGIQNLPAKVLNFLTVNKLLAHQPWLVTPDHMKVHTHTHALTHTHTHTHTHTRTHARAHTHTHIVRTDSSPIQAP